jgi:glycosyltransferase involved in cell wall biosynthesis
MTINGYGKPDISIIIPTFNSAKTISKSIQSVLESDYKGKYEIIVVDDGSTDNTLNLCKEYSHTVLTILTQNNKGAASARNLGANQAKGDILLFLDSDVILEKETLSKFHNEINKPGISYVGARYSITPANNKLIHKYKALHDYYFFYYKSFIENPDEISFKMITNGGVEAYKSSIFKKMGGFDETVSGADVERELLIIKLLNNDENLSFPGNIITRHHFPGFLKLLKNFFYRTIHLIELIYNRDYFPNYFQERSWDLILAPLCTLSFIIGILLNLFTFFPIAFSITFLFFLLFLVKNRIFFGLGKKHYSISFMVYLILVHYFFSNIITLAGFIGLLKQKISRRK